MSYKWKQLSMWDVPKEEFYIIHKRVDTGISSGVCTFLLVDVTDISGDGYLRSTPVEKSKVTEKILELIGEP